MHLLKKKSINLPVWGVQAAADHRDCPQSMINELLVNELWLLSNDHGCNLPKWIHFDAGDILLQCEKYLMKYLPSVYMHSWAA